MLVSFHILNFLHFSNKLFWMFLILIYGLGEEEAEEVVGVVVGTDAREVVAEIVGDGRGQGLDQDQEVIGGV